MMYVYRILTLYEQLSCRYSYKQSHYFNIISVYIVILTIILVIIQL